MAPLCASTQLILDWRGSRLTRDYVARKCSQLGAWLSPHTSVEVSSDVRRQVVWCDGVRTGRHALQNSAQLELESKNQSTSPHKGFLARLVVVGALKKGLPLAIARTPRHPSCSPRKVAHREGLAAHPLRRARKPPFTGSRSSRPRCSGDETKRGADHTNHVLPRWLIHENQLSKTNRLHPHPVEHPAKG